MAVTVYTITLIILYMFVGVWCGRQDYDKVDRVNIVSRATINFDPRYNIKEQNDADNHAQVAILVPHLQYM